MRKAYITCATCFFVVLLIEISLCASNVCPDGQCVGDDDCARVLVNGTTYLSTCESGACVLMSSAPKRLGSQCTANYECTSNHCAQGACAQDVGRGCACTSDTCGSYLLCVDGTCVTYRGLGETCTVSSQCPGECINGTCAVAKLGDACTRSLACDDNLFCDGSGECAETELNGCSVANPIGYCPPLESGRKAGVCTQISSAEVTCIYPTGKLEGEGCDVTYHECMPGFACKSSRCVDVAAGSSCASDDQCNLHTQRCVCVQGQTQSTCQPVINSQYGGCASNLNDKLLCEYSCGVDEDSVKYNHACIDQCKFGLLDTLCCYTCEDNFGLDWFANTNETCGVGVLEPPCCSPYQYCSEPSKDYLCSDYVASTTTSSSSSTTSRSSSTTGSASSGTSSTGSVSTTQFLTTSDACSSVLISGLELLCGAVVMLSIIV